MASVGSLLLFLVPVLLSIIVFKLVKLWLNVRYIKQQWPSIKYYVQPLRMTTSNPIIRVFMPNFLLPLPKMWFKDNVEPFKCPDKIFVLVSPEGFDFYVANWEVSKELLARNNDFPKPIHLYEIINLFGPNIVSLEGDDWKRHRKVASPQFSEANNKLVHSTTVEITQQMFEYWETKSENNECTTFPGQDTFKLTLAVISSAGFGRKLDWVEKEKVLKAGHEYSFQHSIEEVVENLLMIMVTPTWMYSLPIKKIRHIDSIFKEFTAYLKESVHEAQEHIRLHPEEEKKKDNLLYRLVSASDGEQGSLSPMELLSDIWILILAGHETSGTVLHWILLTLAEKPFIQEKLFQEAQAICGLNPPEYSQISSLDYAQAVIYEALRFYPPVLGLQKCSKQSQNVGKFFFPKDSQIITILSALHFDADIWGEDAKEFRPERFLVHEKTSTSKTKYILSFNEGPRICLGKRFALVEMITTLSMIASNFQWRFPQSMTEQEKKDAFKSEIKLTLKPLHETPLVFKKRINE